MDTSCVKNESPERAALVKSWLGKIDRAKTHWDKRFKKMRDCMDFVSGKQWPGQTEESTLYVANITQRHVNQRVAALYAKNPKIVCKRRKRLDSMVWDGTMVQVQQAQMAQQQSMQMGFPPPAEAMVILNEYQAVMMNRRLLDKMAETMELLAQYQWKEQIPPFKTQMKQLVRRTVVCGVSYVKLGYRRLMELQPDAEEQVHLLSEQLAEMERIGKQLAEGEINPQDKEAEQLRLQIQDLQSKADKLVKDEGLAFNFPCSTSIIVDPKCRSLQGFQGADWVAEKYVVSLAWVQEVFGVDLKKDAKFTNYNHSTNEPVKIDSEEAKSQEPMACVYEVYSKRDGLVYYVCEGYCDFLKEPAAPDVVLERFWPWYSLMFNEVENEREIYPQSDVELIMPMQRDYNTARQGLREHRYANRPLIVTSKAAALSEEDIAMLQNRPANAVIQLSGLQAGQKVNEMLQPFTGSPILPELYSTEQSMQDVLFSVGSQEANLGGTAGATATESAIAEGSRMTSQQSNIDDLDDLLSDFSRGCGQVLLSNMPKEKVIELVGTGAVWPDSPQTAGEVAAELDLVIEAGSSGRPNRAAEIANLEKLLPFIIQQPGINPEFIGKQMLQRLDEGIDLTDAFIAGSPSIVAMNGMKQATTGDPATDPNAQGQRGQNNTQQNQPGPNGATPQAPQPGTRLMGG